MTVRRGYENLNDQIAFGCLQVKSQEFFQFVQFAKQLEVFKISKLKWVFVD